MDKTRYEFLKKNKYKGDDAFTNEERFRENEKRKYSRTKSSCR